MKTATPHKISETSRDYWAVATEGGKPLGDVLGGGPTRATRFKAISPENVSMNPEVAPGAYFTSLKEAAEHLAR